MSRTLIALAGIGGTLLALDALWLSTMAERLYRGQLPGVFLDGFRPLPAVAFYLLYMGGVLMLASLPAIEARSLLRAAINGAVLGLVAYGTYDLTNQATLKTWSTTITLADMLWGTVLTASAATVGTWAALRFSP